jgi:hypothetical protein
MHSQTGSELSGRERRRLELARENAWLDARPPASARTAKAYGLWCWRLKIPMVWFERRTPRSRYGRVRLDMFTTPNVLTVGGQAAMKEIGARGKSATTVSAHDACWDGIPVAQLEKTAKAAFRAAVNAGNYRLNRGRLVDIESRAPARALKVAPGKAASA